MYKDSSWRECRDIDFLVEPSDVKNTLKILFRNGYKYLVAEEQKNTEIQETETKLKIAEDKMVREKTLAELVAPLSKDKRQVMVELLESVQTANLKKQFDKYLPAVLNESVAKEESADMITEHTGDRINNQTNINEDETIVDIKRLAGLRS